MSETTLSKLPSPLQLRDELESMVLKELLGPGSVLGYIWVRGRVKTSPRHVLRLRCPTSREDCLLEVRRLLGSRHHVQRRQGHVVCEISSSWLVKSLLGKYGSPPSRDQPDPPLPTLPAAYLPDLARGLLAGAGSITDARKELSQQPPEESPEAAEAETPLPL